MKRWKNSVQSYNPSPESREFSKRMYEELKRLGIVINQFNSTEVNDTLYDSDIAQVLDCLVNNRPIPFDVEQRLLAKKPIREEVKLTSDDVFV